MMVLIKVMFFETNAVKLIQVFLDGLHIDQAFVIKVAFKIGLTNTDINPMATAYVINYGFVRLALVAAKAASAQIMAHQGIFCHVAYCIVIVVVLFFPTKGSNRKGSFLSCRVMRSHDVQQSDLTQQWASLLRQFFFDTAVRIPAERSAIQVLINHRLMNLLVACLQHTPRGTRKRSMIRNIISQYCNARIDLLSMGRWMYTHERNTIFR